MTTPLRVVLVVKTAHGALWTLPQLVELRARGHDVMAVLPAGDGALRRALRAERVPVVDSAFDFRFRPRPATLAGLLALRRQLRALAPDVVLYHLYASAVAVRLAAAGLPPARVHMVAGPLYLESRPIRAVERWLVRLDTVTICGSAATAARYRRLGRPAALGPVVPYGVDTTRFRPPADGARRAAREALGLAPTTLVVVMVALFYAPKRLVHRGRGIKGHHTLLRAWEEFHRAHPDTRLVLVGGGFDAAGRRHRDRLRAEHGGGAGVTWVDTCDDVREWYSVADLSVSPSLSENHGAALEAGAMGVPGIVSDAGALPETVRPGTGWVVPRGDPAALARALEVAHREHAAGTLAARGARARELVVHAFERAACSTAVADLVERAAATVAARRPDPSGADSPGAGSPGAGSHSVGSHSVFCEARFARGADRTWAAGEGADDGSAWLRYTRDGTALQVVARARGWDGPPVQALSGGASLRRLPHYVGTAGLARVALPLVLGVVAAVRAAPSVILRLPGVVGSIAGLYCRLTGRRYAVEVVGDPREVLAAGSLGRPGRAAAGAAAACTRWLVRGADTALYATRSALQERYPAGRGATALGMPNVRLPPAAFVAAARTRDPANLRIIAVGSQEQRYKGHDTLLHAVRRLRDRGVAAEAVIVGGGRAHATITALSDSLDLDGAVTFTGAVHDRARLLDLLDSAAVFAMPSRTEGLPRALLEAMARALPAVGTDVGGIPELLDPEHVVPVDDSAALADACARLLTRPDLWQEQSRRNLDVATGYRIARLEEQFAGWLRQVPAVRPEAR